MGLHQKVRSALTEYEKSWVRARDTLSHLLERANPKREDRPKTIKAEEIVVTEEKRWQED